MTATDPPPAAPRDTDSPSDPEARRMGRQEEITARIEAHMTARRLDMAEAVFGLNGVTVRPSGMWLSKVTEEDR